MRRILHSFRQLRWKLTFSYMLTSVVAFLLVIALFFGSALLWFGTHPSDTIVRNLRQQAAQGATYFASAATNPEPLTTWLQITATNDASQDSSNDPFHYNPIFLTMTDTQGRILASSGPQQLTRGTRIQAQITPQNAANLAAVLHDHTGTTSTAERDSGNTLVAIVPVPDRKGNTQGALILKITQPNTQILFSWFFMVIFLSSILIIILTTAIGTVFGYLIARGLTSRLKRLSAAASRWSCGDFSALAVDTSEDELGQMAHQLNHMAAQLQNLLQARQKLATLEERNRLARDLHDSVKQQIFAISMQIGALKILLRRDVGTAEVRLQKMEKLVQEAQQELTSLIRELRPVALEGKSLVTALRELTPQWSQQTDIVANFYVEGSQTLPITVEEALFRVAQEALSNVARHSKATLVQIILTLTEERVTLSILDDGQGFDPANLEGRGVGLLSMQERMKALGGEVQMQSKPGKGTSIIASCDRLGRDNSEIAGTEVADEQIVTHSQQALLSSGMEERA